MHIRYGYDIEISCEAETPTVAILDIHPDRRCDITVADQIAIEPLSKGAGLEKTYTDFYHDTFGNICRRFVLPKGETRLHAKGIIHDCGFADASAQGVEALPPEELPSEVLSFLLASRYCEADMLSEQAWAMFGSISEGWRKVTAICDFVHEHVRFDYGKADSARGAAQAYEERVGVCRDYAHLAIALCRALNIPARYCTGYLGDIGVEPDPCPMDFSAWFEVYLGGEWFTFDARHNRPRIGRILIARGRDAADVPILHSFGRHILRKFEVFTEEVEGPRFPATSQDRRDHWDRVRSISANMVA